MFSRQHKRRIGWFCLISLLAVIVVILVMSALRQNINLFFTPSELEQAQLTEKMIIRIGGMVVPNSVRYLETRDDNRIHVQFKVRDKTSQITVQYSGVLPDLFREGQSVVVQGRWQQSTLHAVRVLAKHDENYMPPEVAKAMKENHAS